MDACHLHSCFRDLLLCAAVANTGRYGIGVGVDLVWSNSNKRLLVVFACLFFFVVRAPRFAFAQDIFADVSSLVYTIIAACYALVLPMILLGILIGYVEIAGPWNLKMLKKAGRAQIEIGFITLFIFLITPGLLGLLAWIGASLSSSSGSWP